MKKLNPVLFEGILLVASGVRYLADPIGLALVLFGCGVLFFESPLMSKLVGG